jgi:hypothetical protein
MSLLTPLFIAAIAAVSLPILFHLIRRTPQGRFPFSSLMFLTPSPPRLTRRSRLDNLVLLLLRALALILLALAFARPFLREAENLSFDSARGRCVAVLLDTSASMQRADLWQQAMREVRRELDELEVGDDVAFVTFDETVQTVVDFETERRPGGVAKAELVRQQLAALKPTWGRTNLGAALVTTADALAIAGDLQQSDAALQVTLISDLQRGANLASLQNYEWPAGVRLKIRQITAPAGTNATLRILASEEGSAEKEVRVRVTNNGESVGDQFRLKWDGGSTADDDKDLAVYVPAGQSKIVCVPRGNPSADDDKDLAVYVPAGQSKIVCVPRGNPSAEADRLVLSGDDESFDNYYFAVPRVREEVTIGYIGSDAPDDPEGLRYYLELALADTFQRDVTFLGLPADKPLDSDQQPDLLVVTQSLSPSTMATLESYLGGGGCLFAVLNDPESAVQLVSFTEDAEVLAAGASPANDDYVMLGEIDFSHPLFSVFAKPQYNDFTKIHFWKHIRVQLADQPARRILATFDDGSPALWEQRVNEGRLFVLTSGWRPTDSQLALSTKFVPLLGGILDQAVGVTLPEEDYAVHDAIRLPADVDDLVITKPDGATTRVEPDETEVRVADQPGIYRLAWNGGEQRVAVNLASLESETTPLDRQRLEQLGVQMGTQSTRSEEIERERQLRDLELEGLQKIWQWLIASVLALLCMESWLAGRGARQRE